jgi:hypothetical protein
MGRRADHWVLISKYVDHLPLYRIEQIAARAGVALARSALADWVGRCDVALQPLADRLVQGNDVVHADETPVQQLDPSQGKKPSAYLCRPTAADDLDDRASPCSIIKPGAAVPHARAFLEAIWWSMTMPADPVRLRRHRSRLHGPHARRKF